MKNKWIGFVILFVIFPSIALSQGIYTYSRVPGDSVTFAWDGSPIEVGCGTQTIRLTKGQASYVCEGKTYPLIWTGEDVKIVGGKTGGDVVISFRYGFQAVKLGGTGISIPATGPGTYKFNIPIAGKYVVWGYVALDDTGGKDSFFTSMDGGVESAWATLRGPSGWGWDKVSSETSIPGERGPVIVYNLGVSEHTFVLRERESGTQINGLVVDIETSSAPVASNVIVAQGETKMVQVALPLSFGEGVVRMRVRAIKTQDGMEDMSEFSDSDGPNGVVDGVARPWRIDVKTVIVVCTSYTYSEWIPSTCPVEGVQNRTVLTSLPAGCVGGVTPVLKQTCVYVPVPIDWPGGIRLLP